MTIQVQNTLHRLVAHHGYSATFVQYMGEGICMYSIGGIMYRIRGMVRFSKNSTQTLDT
jgi:hypothetical protein